MKLGIALFLGLFVSASVLGANIAVVDSGVDYKHQDLKLNIWENPNSPQDVTDASGKKYKEAVRGWNFAENNNQIIDYKYLGTFSADCTKIFEVQAKILNGTATAAEKEWYDAKKKDATFLKELQKFGNFVHGTHVSGISAKSAEKSKIIGMKLIPTETPGGMIAQLVDEVRAARTERDADNPMAKMFLTMLAKRQAELLITVGKFVAATKADVANGSFGTSVKAVAPVIAPLLKQLLGKEPTEQEKLDYAKFFVSEIVTAAKGFVDASKETLFVFAAGNDGTSNDELPCSPANIKTDNVITVAATNGLSALASFSNYGVKMVEVAAPGVAILSSIPGDVQLAMSGTSMAAPYVTNVAGLVKDKNPALVASNVKQVLMETVDVKSFLQGKVATSGIVNRDRAVLAAELSRTMPLAAAIAQARAQVRDSEDFWAPVAEKDLVVLPLPSIL